MSQIIKPVMLDETGQQSVTKLTEMLSKMQILAEAIEAVHSVNGMTGDVIIDAGTIKTNKLDSSSKTISQILSEEQTLVNGVIAELQAAIARTPVSFSTNVIENDDYQLSITLGTP